VLTVALSLLGGVGPCPDLPLRVGTVWVYSATVSWTDSPSQNVRDTTLTWRTEVLSVRDSAEARIAVVRNWYTALAWWEPSKLPDTTRILCVGDKVYHMDRESIRAPIDDDLLFSFPLATQKLYGRNPKDRDDTFYAWYVESAIIADSAMIRMGAQRGDSAFTITYRSLPDHQILVFVRGLGIVEYTYGHHGTVADAMARLVEFSLGH